MKQTLWKTLPWHVSMSTKQYIAKLQTDTSKTDSTPYLVTIPTRVLLVLDSDHDTRIVSDFYVVSSPLPINKLADIVREETARAGWTEALPLILCSHDENFAWLNRKDNGTTAIRLANPKSAEYQVVRTSLLPGLLKTIKENKHRPVPLKVFEVSDVGLKAPERERKTRNERHFAAVYYGKTSGFEVVHGLMVGNHQQ
jgi:phenylalanyl-tRNA synthetase beta subunit